MKKTEIKLGKTYTPRKSGTALSDTEIQGQHWEAWVDDGTHYFKFDVGHFVSDFKVVEISEEEYRLLRSRKITDAQLAKRYQ